jgi:hypothetical protein
VSPRTHLLEPAKFSGPSAASLLCNSERKSRRHVRLHTGRRILPRRISGERVELIRSDYFGGN